MSIRLSLALSYAGFLVAAGAIVLVSLYVILRYVPDSPLTAANPRDFGIMASRQEILDTLVAVSGFVLVLLALIGLSGGWILAGVLLRPLDRINRAARIAATGRLDHRIRLQGPRDEFKELADSFDHMLERLHDAFETQERFAANASHELRTPLTVTSTLLEVAQANPDGQDYATLLERLRLTNARAIGITEALLRLNNANALALQYEQLDLAEIVGAAVAEFADEAAKKMVTIQTSLTPVCLSGDRTLLEQLTANLIQNAIRHNHEDGSVSVRTIASRDTSTAVLCIENTGDHYTSEIAGRLTEPFMRGAARTNGATSGHGLGLTLVQRITSLHEGELTIAPLSTGGLTTTVSLPTGGRD